MLTILAHKLSNFGTFILSGVHTFTLAYSSACIFSHLHIFTLAYFPTSILTRLHTLTLAGGPRKGQALSITDRFIVTGTDRPIYLCQNAMSRQKHFSAPLRLIKAFFLTSRNPLLLTSREASWVDKRQIRSQRKDQIMTAKEN